MKGGELTVQNQETRTGRRTKIVVVGKGVYDWLGGGRLPQTLAGIGAHALVSGIAGVASNRDLQASRGLLCVSGFPFSQVFLDVVCCRSACDLLRLGSTV